MQQLPDDLVALLVTFLTNKEKKTLRLVSRRLNAFTPLPLSRVFISASYKNIEVFKAVAAHPVISKQVKEIIWDDARFEKFEDDDDDQSELLPEERVKNKNDFQERLDENFRRFGNSEQSFLQAKTAGFDFMAHRPLSAESVTCERYLSSEEDWELYNRLYAEQEIILQEGLDIATFKDGLVKFPQLERITVTSEAYRPTIVNPYYPTPLIRSFPVGFNYPAPWPWMAGTEEYADSEFTLGDIRAHWRGVTLTLVALAQSERFVPEYVIDTRYEQLGVAYQLFDHFSDELRSLQSLCERGLRRLDLAINTFENFQNPGLYQLPRGHLKGILAKAAALEHFSLHTSAGEHPEDDSSREEDEIMNALGAVPIESWPHLKHLTLSSVPVIYSDLLNFLRHLPKSIKSVDLIDVGFTERTYKGFLEDCRDDLLWTANNPRLKVAHYEGDGVFPWRRVCVQEEIARFFSGGHNPFEGMSSEQEIQYSFGKVQDPLDDDFEEAHVPDLRCFVFVSPGVYRMRTREEVADGQQSQA